MWSKRLLITCKTERDKNRALINVWSQKQKIKINFWSLKPKTISNNQNWSCNELIKVYWSRATKLWSMMWMIHKSNTCNLIGFDLMFMIEFVWWWSRWWEKVKMKSVLRKEGKGRVYGVRLDAHSHTLSSL